MAKRKRSSASSSRRTRRRRVARRRLQFRRQPKLTGPMPNKKLVRLRYVQHVSVNPASGLAADYVFRANSIHDPNFTGGGHQPYGHDTLELLYDRYMVVGSKITAEFVSTGTSPATTDAVVGISLEDDSVTNTLTHHWMEQPKSNWKMIGPSDGGKGSAKLTKTFGLKKFFGVVNPADVPTRFGAQFGSNPSETAWYHLMVAPVNPTDDTQLVNIMVTVEYTVLVTELKDLTQS